jgi:hypothetical protein
MHKTSAANHVANEFSNGTPPLTPGTAIDAADLNTWQRELVNVVENAGAGLTLDANDDGQVLEALENTFGQLATTNTWTAANTFSTTLTVTGALTANGGASVASGLTVSSGNLSVSSGSVSASTTVTAGTGLTVTSGGATVTAGGLTVTAGGVTVNGGGVTVSAGGLTVTNDGTNISGGFLVTGIQAGFTLSSETTQFTRNATNGSLRIVPATGNPSAPNNGEVWYDDNTHELKVRINGVTRVFTVT